MRPLVIPPTIRTALDNGATLVISISGGKDSQAMLNTLTAAHRNFGWSGSLPAVHANWGRAEWPQTLGHCKTLCVQAGIPLTVVQRTPGGDLVDRWKERMETLRGTGKPFWSSAAQRYCASDLKRNPINAFLRQSTHVVSAEGIRAEESPARTQKPVWAVRDAITTRTRAAYTWYPLFDWPVADVWDACETSLDDLARRRQLFRAGSHHEALDGWPAHPAYVFGNQRLSCALCILASKNDLMIGAQHNPDLYRELVDMENESGFSFRSNFALKDPPRGEHADS